jgi:uncharacterized protein YkwD
MRSRKRYGRALWTLGVVIALLAATFVAQSSAQSNPTNAETQQVFLPAVSQYLAIESPPLRTDWLAEVNAYRTRAGVPPVQNDDSLNRNCFEHARYMAINGHLTHDQNPNLPYASPNGQACAARGNAWLGGEYFIPIWTPSDSIEGWMESVGHRLWLLYPTTPRFGYGFYMTENNQAGAALDILSWANFDADAQYGGWPLRYPAAGQTAVPDTRYPITLSWAYFGSTPRLNAASLATVDGRSLLHTANTDLPVGHKGIQILPAEPLPSNTTIIVNVTGSYNGAGFNYTWQFTTGDGDPYP